MKVKWGELVGYARIPFFLRHGRDVVNGMLLELVGFLYYECFPFLYINSFPLSLLTTPSFIVEILSLRIQFNWFPIDLLCDLISYQFRIDLVLLWLMNIWHLDLEFFDLLCNLKEIRLRYESMWLWIWKKMIFLLILVMMSEVLYLFFLFWTYSNNNISKYFPMINILIINLILN